MSETFLKHPRVRPLLPAAAVALVVIIVAAVVVTRSASRAGALTNVPTFAAQTGPLVISVTESGTIKPQEQIILKSELEGQTTLIYLIPEGTRVEEGDLLAQLDASKLQDDRVEQQIKVDNAEAEAIRARENLAVVKNQSESDVSKAELAYNFAQEDIKKYTEGEYPQKLREADAKITLARETMERAAEKLRWSERLFAEKYLSQSEKEADRLTHKSAELDLQLAQTAKELLEKYTNKRQLDQLKSDVEQTGLALERARLKANADIVQAEAAFKAKDAEFQQQKNKLAKVNDQIIKTKISAPRAGLVVYATSTRSGGGRGGMTQPLEEGQTVRERQELIYLPSTSAMMAELMIHESSLEKAKLGQPVRVTVDAMPGRIFEGQVKFIAPLPDAMSSFMNPDRKVYTTRVNLEGNHPDLRTGMSCRAEILVDQYENATYVPVQAVVRVAGQPTVYVRTGDKFNPRTVDIGLDNSSMIHVRSGLTAGEVVSLTPPLDTGTSQGAAVAAPLSPLPTSAPSARAAGGPPTSRPGAEVSEEDRAARRERMQNMTPEERAAERRKRMESMTPEQREEFQRRMRERQSGGEGDGAPRGDDAGRSSERPGGDNPGRGSDRPRPPANDPGRSPERPGGGS
jgi:HlyD family secretion protein